MSSREQLKTGVCSTAIEMGDVEIARKGQQLNARNSKYTHSTDILIVNTCWTKEIFH